MHPPVRRLRITVALCLFVVLSACSPLRALDEEPRVALVNLRPVQIQLLEQRYLATIRIQNPNPVALPIHGLDYTLSINGAAFAEGVSSQRVSIPAYGEKTLELGVTSTIIKLLEQLRRVREAGGRITYGISGTLGIEGLEQGIKFQREGEIDLRFERTPQGQAA